MTSDIVSFTKNKDFLVCVDSDGCAMDTMDVKHIRCFGPCMVEEWGLDRWREPILSRWNEINLYTMTRGINRFQGLRLALEEISARYTPIDGVEELAAWVDSTKELSNSALETAIAQGGGICLRKALAWSGAVNLAITDSAYDGVSTVVADSKTDLYKLNDEYLATHENPFPERGQIEERGFFLFGDGEKNAQFTSPEAIYVVADEDAFDSRSSGGGGGGSSSSRPQQPDQPDQPSQDENMFNDVSSSAWYAEAVEYVYDNGLMTGVSGSSFAPNNTLTRAMVVQTLYAMAGKPEVSGSESFADVASNDWFADAVTWASANGIVNGYSAAQFAPGDPVTREQLALILYGYAQIRGYNTTQGGMSIREFSDYGAISDWALEAMDWAVNAGLLSGKGNGVLDPAGTATRAEVAQILMNFSENIAR